MKEQLQAKPSIRQIDDPVGIEKTTQNFVEDYQNGRQNDENSFTQAGIKMVVSKYTRGAIEEDTQSEAIKNGKLNSEYKEFCDKQRSEALKEIQQLEKQNAQQQDDYIKAKISANKEIAQTWDVGDSQSLNMSQNQEQEQENRI